MFVPFEKIGDHARIWVYQANRKFNSQESEIISQALESFIQGWQVHGSPMHASFDLRFDQFIIIAADEVMNAASGCSIDDSVRTFKKLGTELNVDFFDRSLVTFKKEDEVLTIATGDLKLKLNEGMWDSNSLVFNNLVATKKELNEKWLAPARTTWLKRYLPQHSVIG